MFAKGSSGADESDAMFPFDLQRLLEISSSSTRMMRFIRSLPPHSTLLAGLDRMQKAGVDHRFFVDQTLSADEERPTSRKEWLRLALQGSPKGRVLLRKLALHIIDKREKKVLIFVNNPMTGQWLKWVSRPCLLTSLWTNTPRSAMQCCTSLNSWIQT